jgi:mono/diheme cytochrome c family protein
VGPEIEIEIGMREKERRMNQRTLALGIIALGLAGCGVTDLDLGDSYSLSSYTRSELFPTEKTKEAKQTRFVMSDKADALAALEKRLKDTLDKYFLAPWTWTADTVKTSEQLAVFRGQQHYQQHCIHCHGKNGDGKGPTAEFLFPRPRDYRRGVFKWKSTPKPVKPTREDLVRVLREGAEGTSMPPFRNLSDQTISELVDYVVYLAKRGEVERQVLLAVENEGGEFPDEAAVDGIVRKIDKAWFDAPGQTAKTERGDSYSENAVAATDESIKRGRELFLGEKGGCHKCHGKDGKANPGDVPPDQQEDDWGNINYPRNLHLGLFRGGRRPVDLYRRIHEGIAGVQMPEAKGKLTPDEIWDLVNFVRNLPYRKGLLAAEAAPAKTAAH